MLNIQTIRDNKDRLQEVADQKGIHVSISQLLEWDEQKRKLLQQVEQLRQSRNKHTQHFQAITQNHTADGNNHDTLEAQQLKLTVKEINNQITVMEAKLAEVEQPYQSLLQLVPNLVSPDTPVGLSDADNIEIRVHGKAPEFDFRLRDHVALGELHEIIDLPVVSKQPEPATTI